MWQQGKVTNKVGIQNPLPVDGDSVYSKDVDIANSDNGTFTGQLENIFSQYSDSDVLVDSSATTPKWFSVKLHRPIVTNMIGLSSAGGNFSNVKISLKDIAGTVRQVVDDSGNDTDYTSNIYEFTKTTSIEILFEFYTTDAVSISGSFIQKMLSRSISAIDGYESETNSTTTVLAGASSFTGTPVSTKNYGTGLVSVYTDQVSATDGLKVQFRKDPATPWRTSDEYTISSDDINTLKTFSTQFPFDQMSVTYENGATQQGTFELCTILKPVYSKPSSHRVSDTISGQDDAELVKSNLTGERPDGLYGNVAVTNGNNLKISLEELESGISSNNNSQLNTTPFESGGGEYKQDLKTGAFTTVTYAHHEIHSGSHFFTGNHTTLANGATYDILIVTPNTLKYAHMTIALDTEAEATFNLYEGTTTSADGTALIMFDRNRNTDNTPTVTTYHTPTITAVGTELTASIFGSGKQQGGGLRDSNEIVLKANTKYLVRVTNNTVSTNWYDWSLDWYEHVDR